VHQESLGGDDVSLLNAEECRIEGKLECCLEVLVLSFSEEKKKGFKRLCQKQHEGGNWFHTLVSILWRAAALAAT